MIAVAFVFGFIPTMVEPFTGGQEITIAADRVTDQITDGMMAVPGKPSVLNATCTYAFFDASYGSGDDCALSYDETETDLTTRLAIDSTYSVNVSIRRNVTNGPTPEILCTDGTSVHACSLGGDRLAIGPEARTDGSVVSTRRTRFIDEKDVLVVVKVW